MIVGVAEDVVVPLLFVMRLFVNVFVELIEGIAIHSTARTQAAERDRVVSLLCQSSIVELNV